jgi:hypothetical protein
MPRMKRFLLGVSLVALVGCGGPTSEGQDVKTPDELIAEQERLAAEQERQRAQRANDYDNEVDETDDEKARKWDEKQAELELKRAARSAETCPGSVTEKAPAGTATVTLVFRNDGHVKSSEIASPYADTAVGACVLRAMGAVIVPAYEGEEKTVTWEIELKEPPQDTKAKK